MVTGYLGKPEIGEAVLRAYGRVRAANPAAVYACDPVIGDEHRGFYVAPGVGGVLPRAAVPAATLLTPNAFEVEALTGLEVRDRPAAVRALAALRARGPEVVVATSLTLDETPADALDMMAVDGNGAWAVRTPKLPIALSGTGDLFTALFFHHWLTGRSAAEALSKTASAVFGVVAATYAAGADELAIVAAQEELVSPSRLFAAEAV